MSPAFRNIEVAYRAAYCPAPFSAIAQTWHVPSADLCYEDLDSKQPRVRVSVGLLSARPRQCETLEAMGRSETQ
eukprot:gene23005-30197_t